MNILNECLCNVSSVYRSLEILIIRVAHVMFDERELIADRHSEQREFDGAGFAQVEGNDAREEWIARHRIEARDCSATVSSTRVAFVLSDGTEEASCSYE